MKKFFVLSIIVLAGTALFAQGGSLCNIAEPFCSDSSYSFPMNTNTSAQTGPNYACLCSQPNPYWYYMLIDQSGPITIYMQSPTGNDIDFVAWGPYTSPTAPCTAQLTANCSGCASGGCPNNTANPTFYPSGNVVDCSYDPAYFETIHISNAVSGDYYLLCITNYSNQAGDITFNQTNYGQPGAGSTNCNIVYCDMTSLTAVPGTCLPSTNQYSVSGQIIFTDAPATGTLIVTDQASGVSYTFNAPFTSPISYMLAGILSDGASHSVTATFSDAPTCSLTVTYSAPQPCNQCFANSGPDQSVCGLTATLAAVEAVGDQNTHWLPTTGITFGDATSPTTTITAAAAGTYTLTWQITNAGGITCTDQVAVTFNPIPTSSFSTNTPVCEGTNITATYTGSGGQLFSWNFGSTATPPTAVTQGPHSVSYPAPGTYPISLTVTSAAQCISAVTTQNVVVNPNPPSNFTAVSPVCAGDPSQITIGFTPGAGYTYVWTVSPAGTPAVLNGSGPFSVTWASPTVVTITLQVTNTNTGCVSTTSSQQVNVLASGTPNCCMTPSPNAGADATNICGFQYTLNASVPTPGNTAQWSMISGPGVATFSNSTANNSTVSVTSAGSYVFQWHEVSGACDSSDQVTVSFIQRPNANIPLERLQICGNSTPMSAVISVAGSIGLWTVVPFQTATFTPNNTSPNVTVTAGSGYGTYFFVWTEGTSMSCYSRDTIRVEFLETPNTGAGIDTTTCGYNVTLHADPTYPGYWTASTSNVIYQPSASDPNASAIIPNYTTSSYGVTFTWHAVNGICEGTDAVVVTFLKPPHTEAGPTQSICGYTTTLHADTTGAGIIWAQWLSSVTGITIDQTGNVPANADVDASTVGNFYVNSARPVYFYWVAQNGQGCSNIDSCLITFFEIPEAYAGVNDSVCGKTYDLVGQFSIDNPSGSWSVYTKPYVTSFAEFLPPTQADGEVTVSDYGVYEFIFRESNAGNLTCLDRDTIQIYFMTIPHPDAGLDQDICGKYVELYAFTTPGTDGYWQSILDAWYDPTEWSQGDTVLCLPCSNDSSVVAYFSSENVTVTYYWMEFNGMCYGYDSVNVYFGSIQAAIPLVDPADSTNCGRNTDLLVAQEPTYGDGFWYDSVPLTQFYPNNFNDNPDSTVISTSSYGMHYFYWVTENGDCRDTSDVVPINFIRQPEALAGPVTNDPNTNTYFPGIYGPNSHIKADTVCGLAYYLHAQPSYGNGLWFTLDPVNTWFESTGTSSPSPIPDDTANINYYTVFNAPYYRQFVWIEDNLSCVDKDTIRIYFAPRPSGNFTATMPACRFDSSMIIAHTWPLPNNIDYGINYFGWDFGSGIIWDTSISVFDSSTIYVSWPSGNSHSVTLITENLWECRSTINQHTINEPPLFSPQYDINPATCDNSNGEIILFTDTNTYQFEWLDSNIVNPLDTGQYGLAPGSTYQVVVTGQSLSPDANPGTLCHDTIGITMTNSGNIAAFFDTLFTQMLPVPQSLPLINLTNNGRRYSWRIFDEDGNLVGTTSTVSPTWNFEEPGCYRIVLVAESKVDTSWFGIERFGCRDTFEYKWLCFDATPILEVPNVFTPNADGINDVFLVNAKSLTEFHAILFNRWGRKIYEWDDYTKGWDGKIGGADASPGVYYYVITATGKDDTEFEVKGFFYLMREK